jgi:hypothetical protein
MLYRSSEVTMKTLRFGILMAIVCAAFAYPQTQDLGNGAFADEKGPIMIAVDVTQVIQDMKSPYSLFVLYLAARNENQNIVVGRNDVTLVYKGQEYKMRSLEELRKNYQGEIRDVDFYSRLAAGGLVSSWIRFYKFTARTDFFPVFRPGAPLPADEGSMSGFIGFRTKCYFKNPGFEKGDKLTIKIRDKKNPEITGEVEVTLK